MRVVQVNKFHYIKGGAERYYFDLSGALARRGHVVQHLAMAHPRNDAAGPGDRFVGGVDYRGVMTAGERARQGLRSIYNQEAAARAREMAGPAPRPIAHLHNVYHQLSPSVICAFDRAGVPVVQTLHDYKLICPAYLLLTEGRICERCRGGRYFEAARHRCLLDSRGASLVAMAEAYLHAWGRTYQRVCRFLCPSRFLLEKVAEFGVPRTKLVHLPYFVPLEQYQATPVPARGPGEPEVAVYVGRLSREKGVATLLEAMALLPPGRLRLDLLGEGPLREELEAKMRAACPDGRVRFVGYQSGTALHETIRNASFAVVPSEWYENLPYSVLEPFALGRPVVGARIGGIPELVREGETGSLFEAGNSAALSQALLRMTASSADLQSMGLRARQRMEREHAEGPHVDRLLEIYREVAT